MYINNKHKEIVENRRYEYIGSYKKDEITIDGKNNKKNTYIRVKCPYCGTEYDVRLGHFRRGDNCTNCCNKYENSLAYHIQQELKEPLNKYWDWEKNVVNPYCINKNTHKKVWIKCNKVDYHGSYETVCSSFTRGNRCPYCNSFASHKVHKLDSFAQYHIEHTDKDFLEKYWSNKNTIDPFTISPSSSKKIFIKCQEKEYHGDYETTCNVFTAGHRCSYCYNQKIHPLDSFGSLYPEKAKYWSKRNKKSPYEVAPKVIKKYWFICEDCGSEFERSLNNINSQNGSLKCHNCTTSKGEQKINKYLKENNIDFIPQKQFNNLIGLKGGNLSYDFYLPKQNLLIEYQGEQHEKFVKNFHNSIKDFEKQLEHDRRKKKYAINHNINLLEIWYYDFDNIEEILNKTLYN